MLKKGRSRGAAPRTATQLFVALAPVATLVRDNRGHRRLLVDGVEVGALSSDARWIEQRLDALARGEPVSLQQPRDPAVLAQWLAVLDVLASHRAMRYVLRRGAGILATLDGGVPAPGEFTNVRVTPATTVLSRLAFLRRGDEGLMLESPRATCVLHLRDDIIVRYLALLAARSPSGVRGVPMPFLALLQSAGFLTAHGDGELPGWSFADALTHARSRAGRHTGGFGATFPLRNDVAPDAALKAPMSRSAVTLPRPKRSDDSRADSLKRVLEDRRSLRDYANRPLTKRELGEFLHRSAQVQRGVVPVGGDRPDDVTFRPTPSGGACHSLEVYVGIRDCDGLRRGLYHYDPLRHRLEVLPRTSAATDALLAAARAVVPGQGMPQAMILITSRFARVMWKYESMAYATILKDAGALLQTMYLVATSMGLAPCAVGGGDSQFFADAVGTDFFTETTVAEFLLGVPHTGPVRNSA